MKNLNLILKSLFLPFIFVILFTIAHADNNGINGTCPGEYIEEITGTTTDATHTENGGIGSGGNDRYRMTFPVAGTLSISATNRNSSKNANYNFYVSRNSCGDTDADWNIVSAEYGTSHSTSVTVNAGDTIYVRLQSISSEPNKGRHDYALELDFTSSAVPTCTLRDSDTLTSADPVYDRYRNNSDWNVRPASHGTTERFFQFNIDDPGDVEVTLYDIDDDQARFTVSQSPCPTDSDGLKNTTVIFATPGVLYVRVYFFDNPSNHNSIEYGLRVELTTPTVTVLTAVDDTFSTSANTALVGNVFSNDIGTGFTISNVDQVGLQGILTDINVNTGAFTFQPSPDFAGPTSFTYTIDDGSNTSTATVQISVSTIAINAVDDSFDTYPDVTLRDNILQNDEGLGITVDTILITQPTQGSVTVQTNGDFIYIPSGGYRGDDTFTYQITDANGNTDRAVVTITIGTAFTSGGSTPFEIVNPDFSRNVIGDYKIAGNTVLCLIDKTNGYGDDSGDEDNICHDSDYQFQTSNNRVSKYLDIDGDNGTWNSTSSYIDLNGTPYDPTRGVIWAGLFWEGRISSADTYKIRYYTENYPSSPTAIEVGEDGSVGNIDVTTIGTQNIKLKIDNGSYNDVLASTFHTAGQTYSAYADVSAVLQSASLTKDKHVFTVANLTTMEGREGSPGAFGGWALVVVYAEVPEFGKPRNISIYNGFIDIGEDDDPITISGFKLPTTGDVLAQLSVFSGEGEHLYGYRAGKHNNHDWLKISNDDSSYSYMPGLTLGDHVGNRDNSFNAQLDNILRDNIPGEFNDLAINNVGVDIDNYDVSDLMTGYRDLDPNISEVQIKTSSDWDYITMSMIAFSAELYVPELCYDYTLDIDGHVIPSVNNEIETPFGNFGRPLTTALYLKSLEGDIDLTNVNVNYRIGDTSQITYNECPGSITSISETGEFAYTPACEYTHSASATGFEMYIGKNKTISQGGTISAFEDRYIKFESDLKKSSIDTYFTFSVDYTVDYGSGAVPITQIFGVNDLCEPTSNGFLPQLGMFNITDINSPADKWNLYTQVSNRPFDLKLYAYTFDANDYLTPMPANTDLNLSVEVEVIRADDFSRDANTACNNENSLLDSVPPKFLNFNDGDGESVEFGYSADDISFAYRSAAMRIWYLTDENGDGTLINNHNCTRETQPECVELYNDQYTQDTSCNVTCSLNNTSLGNCYDCLRTNYGRKVCSRDNFAIRPESFITQIYDSNQSNLTTDPINQTLIANSTITASEFSLISGYDYRFDINATNHVNDIATPRYIQHFAPGSDTHYVRMNWWPDGQTVSGCNDVEDKNISLNIFNGSNVNPVTDITYVDKVDQIGKYRFEVHDENWTSADWDDTQMLHHEAPTDPAFVDYSGYYDATDDCVPNSNDVLAISVGGKQGCVISSVHINADTGTEYLPLFSRYYPYTFNTTGLTIGAGPTNDKNFVYINTLDRTLYPNGIDENMSFNTQGTFFAAGYEDDAVSNFVDNCYAENVNMTLQHAYLSDVPTDGTHNLVADLIDHNTSDSSLTYPNDDDVADRIRTPFSNTLTKDVTTGLTLTQNSAIFVQDMQGAITMDLGFNFDRTYNTTLNPRRINFSDFNITYATQPATVYVDLVNDYKILGNRPVDQNITFLYARAKPGKTFYDDVTAANIDTPVSIVVYCDLGYAECQNRGISALVAQTNEANWWKSWDHSNQAGSSEGNIELVNLLPASALNSTSVSILSEGEDKAINVSRGTATLPATVPIDLVLNDPANPPAPANYTDRWLIYNPESATVAPSPFYRVRFIGGSGWAGQGDTGHVVGGTSNTKKNRRLEW